MTDPSSTPGRDVEAPTIELTEQSLPHFVGRPVPAIETGQRCGRYVVLRELGAGGMSVVYAAYDPELDRQIALKLMRPVSDGRTGGAGRLLREAQALARLAHPNVVHVYDVGTVDDQVYLAMELVEGRSLGQWVKDEQPGWRAVVDVLVRAGKGLAAAHAAGLVHLDFKPGNVLIGDDERVRVVDFGLARRPRSPESLERAGEVGQQGSDSAEPSVLTASTSGSGRLDEPLTECGVVTGTPGYIAPELLLGLTVDAHADQFAFCVALFKCLSGALPFPRTTPMFLRSVEDMDVATPRSGRLPRFVARALRRGLLFHPRQRFESMEQLLAALSVRRHDQRRFAAIGALGIAAAVAGTVLWPGGSDVDCERGFAEIESAWNEQSQRQLGEAFAASGVERAVEGWARVSPRLDRWTTQWADAYREACEATHLRREQSEDVLGQRMLCLRKHRVRFGAMLTLLASPDADVVGHLDGVVASLPAVQVCDEESTLAALRDVTEDQREQILRVEEIVAESSMSQIAGHFGDAVESFETALAIAEQSRHAPTILEVKRGYGAALCESNRCDEGVALLDEAAWEAEALGLDRERFANYREQLTVRSRFRSEFERAQWFANAATGLGQRLSVPTEDLAHLQARIAALADMRGQHAEALDFAERAIELRESADMPKDSLYTVVLNYKGNALFHLGRYEEALKVYEETLAADRARFGDRHPAIAAHRENLGNARRAMGDLEGALKEARISVEILHEFGLEESRGFAHALLNLGGVYTELENYAEASVVLARSVAVSERTMPGSPMHGVAMLNLGEALFRSGDLEQSLGSLERAAAALEKALGPEHAYLGAALATLGHLQVAREDYAAARESLRRARPILLREGGDPVARAEAEVAWAQAMAVLEPSQLQAARDVMDDAIAQLEAIAPRGGILLSEARRWRNAQQGL